MMSMQYSIYGAVTVVQHSTAWYSIVLYSSMYSAVTSLCTVYCVLCTVLHLHLHAHIHTYAVSFVHHVVVHHSSLNAILYICIFADTYMYRPLHSAPSAVLARSSYTCLACLKRHLVLLNMLLSQSMFLGTVSTAEHSDKV